jgi:hypothetical protein
VAHARVGPRELHDCIVAEVRRTLAWPGFEAEFALMRLPRPDKSGATWWLRTLSENMLRWNTDCLDAFVAAVERAQQAFELIE